MFPENGKLLGKEEWWNLFWNNDVTVLKTKKEHSKNCTDTMIYQLDWQQGYFAGAKLIGFHFGVKTEGAFVKSLIDLDESEFIPISEFISHYSKS